MASMFTRLLICLAVALQNSAYAGGRGGHVTAFDPNLFGGNWACFRSLASGTCGGATAHYSGAVCDGVTDDHVAMKDWLTYANGFYPAMANLFVPPGCKLHLDGSNDASCSFQADVLAGEVGLPNNSIVWAYGVTTDCLWVGGLSYPNGTVAGIPQQALINTASAGATTITVNDGNIGTFSVGRWIAVTGICIQANQSGNPDQQYFEYKLITNIAGNVITLDSPLVNSYEASWPLMDLGTSLQPAQGGPALIYLLNPTWNVNGTLYGLSSTYQGQTNVAGRNLVVQDMVFGGVNGFAPSSSKNIWVFGSFATTVEVDKNFELFSMYNTSIASQILSQSASGTMTLSKVTAAGLGTLTNTNVTASKFNTIVAGPSCCGAGNSLNLDGVSYTSTPSQFHFANISDYTFAGGVLSISVNAAVWRNSGTTLWVPGHKYYVGDSDGSNTCSPANTFTVSDVQLAASTVNITTNLPSISFGNTCGAGTRAPTTFGSYRVMSLTSKFSGPGNLLSNPEVLGP